MVLYFVLRCPLHYIHMYLQLCTLQWMHVHTCIWYTHCNHHFLIGMSHEPVYKAFVTWYVICIVLAIMEDTGTLVLGTGFTDYTFSWK